MEQNKNTDLSWEQLKDELKDDYPNLTMEELAREIEKEGELLKRIQKRVGKNKQEIREWLSMMG